MLRQMAALYFGLWAALSFQVSANANKSEQYSWGVEVPVSECRAADRRTNKMVFPHKTNPQSHFIQVDEYLYQVTFESFMGDRVRYSIQCYRSERVD